MSYETAALEELEAHADARDRTAYYSKLVSLHDPYGAMALGVVKQSNIAGWLRVATPSPSAAAAAGLWTTRSGSRSATS